MKRASPMKLSSCLALLFAAACLMAPPVQAQRYPTKSVRVIVPNAAGGAADITARAVAPLHQLIGFAEPLMTLGQTKVLFLKGQDVEAELTEAAKYWKLQPRLHASLTGGQGWIVELDSIERQSAE